jgi:type II secretory pathway pseudopilin PulG
MDQAQPKGGYSIVELLGVLVIIGVLIGLVLPAIRLVQRSSEKRRARAEATALVQAVMHYRQEYGHWPLATDDRFDPGGGTPSNLVAGVATTAMPGWLNAGDKARIPANRIDQFEMIQALRPDSPFNPRAMAFLEIPDDSLDARDGVLRYVDPWRQPYVLIMEPDMVVAGWPVGDVPAVAFSFGPPATGSKGLSNLVFSAEVAQ